MGMPFHGDLANLRRRVYGGLANLSQRDYDDLDNLCKRVYIDFANTVQNHNHSQVAQCSKLGFCLCSKCSNSLFQKDFTNNLENIRLSDFDFLDPLSPSSVLADPDRNSDPFPLDSTSSFGDFQIDENYAENTLSDQKMQMLNPHYLDIPKDRSCPGINGYNTKENVLLNNFDGDDSRLNLKHCKPYEDIIQTDQQIELTKNIDEDWAIPALANPCSQDYLDIPKAGSCSGFNGNKTKEVLNNFDGDDTRLNLRDRKPNGDFYQTDELSKIFEEFKTKMGMSSVLRNGYNRDEALSNPFSQDYLKMINASKTKLQESSSLAIPPNGLYNIFDSGNFGYNMDEPLANPYFEDYLQMINGSKTKLQEASDLAIPYNDLYSQLDSGMSQSTSTNQMFPWKNQAYKRIPNPRRDEQLKRYFAKKDRRKFGKQIRYESRKTTAITKRRMKGRFIKAGAEFDYDPSANNIKKGKTKIVS